VMKFNNLRERRRFCQLIRALARRQRRKTILDALTDSQLIELLYSISRRLLQRLLTFYDVMVEGKKRKIHPQVIFKWRRGSNPLNRYNVPLWTAEFVYAIYALLGDGSLQLARRSDSNKVNKCVTLQTTSLEFAWRISTALRRSINPRSVYAPFFVTHKGNWRICFINAFTYSLLDLAKNKGRIDFLLNIAKGFEKEAIRGFADAEGWVYVKRPLGDSSDRIGLSNTDTRIIKLISQLLRSLGIKHRYCKSQSSLVISRQSYKKFMEVCGFSLTQKRKSLQKIIRHTKSKLVLLKCPYCQRRRQVYKWTQKFASKKAPKPLIVQYFHCTTCGHKWVQKGSEKY